MVYEPDEVDSQGDFATASEIEQACWEFNKMLQGQSVVAKAGLQVVDTILKAAGQKEPLEIDITELSDIVAKNGGTGLGLMHALWTDGIGDIVENYIAPTDMSIGDQQIKKGTWLMGIVWSPTYYELVKSNQITGLSLGGTANRIPVQEGGVNGAESASQPQS